MRYLGGVRRDCVGVLSGLGRVSDEFLLIRRADGTIGNPVVHWVRSETVSDCPLAIVSGDESGGGERGGRSVA